jgi:hypothetical protein
MSVIRLSFVAPSQVNPERRMVEPEIITREFAEYCSRKYDDSHAERSRSRSRHD